MKVVSTKLNSFPTSTC